MRVVSQGERALVERYVGGLAHVHTRLSNHPGHYESDQTVRSLVDFLTKNGLAGDKDAPLQYVMFNDHVSNPAWPAPVRAESARARKLDRRVWRERLAGVTVLFGFEASLMPDGRTDLPWQLAEDCELVIASRHVVPENLEHDGPAMQDMFERACANPAVDVLGHPARHIEGVRGMDWARIFELAARYGTAIEVNMNTYPDERHEPARTRWWAQWLNSLEESGADVFLGSDMHNERHRERFFSDWQRLGHGGPSLLASCVAAVAEAGIEPGRVVNANLRQFNAWLALDKVDRRVRTRVRAAATSERPAVSPAPVLAQRAA